MNSIKSKVIYSLFVLTALLLLANALVNIKPKDQSVAISKKVHKQNQSSVEKRFLSILSDWGIRDEWIKKIRVKGGKSVSHYIYQIKLPAEITPDFLLLDFRNAFNRKNEKLISEDLLKKKKTLVEIFSDKKLVIEAYIKRDNKIKRKKQFVAFLVDERSFDPGKLNRDLLSSNRFTFLFRPSLEVVPYLSKIQKHHHSYALIIDDEIGNGDFDMFTSTDKYVLKTAIRKLVSIFGKDIFYFYDKHSEFYRSVTFNFVRDKFNEMYGINLTPISRIKDLTSKSPDEIQPIIKIYLTTKGKNAFLINDEQVNSLKNLFGKLWKKGVRFKTLEKL